MSKKQYKEKNTLFKKNLKPMLFSLLILSFIVLTFAFYFNSLSLIQNKDDDDYASHLAYGHALPVTYSPEPNSIINKNQTVPSKITISFSERPDPKVSSIEVLNSNNQRVDNNDFKITGQKNNKEATVTLDKNKLTDGVYTVSWLTMSSDDGHIAKGSYVFGIGNISGSSSTGSVASNTITTNNNNKFSQQHQIKTEAVTSAIDGLIKWPLIIAQSAIVGGIVSHLFLWNNNKFIKKVFLSTNKEKPSGINTTNSKESSENVAQINNKFNNYDNDNKKLIDKSRFKPLKIFLMVLCASSASVFICGTALLFLQISDLSTPNSNYLSIFGSLLVGHVGEVWIIRSVVSAVVIVSSIFYYFLEKRKIKRELYSGYSENQKIAITDNTSTRIKRNSFVFFLYIALTAGAIGIFANSMTSHNSAVTFMPTLAISLDWLHFMAVSVWLGGLFYISTVILTLAKNHIIVDSIKINRKPKDNLSSNFDTFKKDAATSITSSNTNDKENKDFSSKTKSDYFLALLLPKFSLLATISLGIIGVSGLYMAWIHLHSFNSLFDTAYGNILIVKLLTILPVVLLGGYHQLTLRNFVVSIASSAKKKGYPQKINKEKEEKEGKEQLSAIYKERSKSSSYFTNNVAKIKRNGFGRFFSFKDNSSFKNKKYNKDNQNKILKENYSHNVFSRFSKTIKIESVLGIVVLFVASMLTITSPPASMNVSSSSSATTMTMMGPGMSTTNNNGDMSQNMVNQNQHYKTHNNPNTANQQIQNNSFTKEEKIMDTNTKIQINPFYTGFNTFKVTFTGTDGKPAQNISNVVMQFTDDEADIGPIVVPLNKISEGVFSIFGGYLSQQGNWTVQLTAQRINAYDLNSEFDINVKQQQQTSASALQKASPSNPLHTNRTQSSSSLTTNTNNNTTSTTTATANNNSMTMNQSEAPPSFDSFAILAIILSALVVFSSAYYFKKSKQQLKETIAMFEKQDKD